MRSVTYWLRWLAVLPGGTLAALLATFPLHWFLLFLYYFGGGPDSIVSTVDESGQEHGCALMGLTCVVSIETAERLGTTLITPIALIYAGSRIAPSHRLYAATALFTLWALAIGALVTLAMSNGAYSGWGWLELGGAIILGLVGSLGTLYAQFKTWREAQEGP